MSTKKIIFIILIVVVFPYLAIPNMSCSLSTFCRLYATAYKDYSDSYITSILLRRVLVRRATLLSINLKNLPLYLWLSARQSALFHDFTSSLIKLEQIALYLEKHEKSPPGNPESIPNKP